MNRFSAALAALVSLAQPAFATDICAPGAVAEYPLDEGIAALGMTLRNLDRADYPLTAESLANAGAEPTQIAPILADYERENRERATRRRALLDELALTPQPRRDAMLLAGLSHQFDGSRPLVLIATMTDNEFLEEYLAVLDRHELGEIADIAREAVALFGGDPDPTSRYNMWLIANGITDPAFDGPLLAMEARLAPLQGQVLARAGELAQSDAGLLAELRERQSDTGALTRLLWAADRVLDCAGDWYDEADRGEAPLNSLPEPQRDLAQLHLFMMEVMNGGVHQFFFNSTGAMAPDIAQTLRNMSLPDHADTMMRGIKHFPAPYPRATEQRRRIMASFDEARDEALHDLTGIMDDGEIYRAMVDLAISSGFMPELAQAPE